MSDSSMSDAFGVFASACAKSISTVNNSQVHIDGNATRNLKPARADTVNSDQHCKVAIKTMLMWCDELADDHLALVKPTKALWSMSLSPRNCRWMIEAGAIDVIKTAIENQINTAKKTKQDNKNELLPLMRHVENLVACLCNLACVDKFRKEIASIGFVSLLLKICDIHLKSDSQMLKHATSAIWVLLLQGDNVQQFVENNGVQIITRICLLSRKQKNDTLVAAVGSLRIVAMSDYLEHLVNDATLEAILTLTMDQIMVSDAAADKSDKPPDLFLHCLGTIKCIAEDEHLSPGLFDPRWVSTLLQALRPRKPAKTASPDKKTSTQRQRVPKFFSEQVVEMCANVLHMIVLLTPDLRDEAVAQGCLPLLVNHITISTGTTATVAMLQLTEAIVDEHTQALQGFLRCGGLEAILDSLSHVSGTKFGVLPEIIQLLRCVVAGVDDVVSKAKEHHYDLVGMLQHRSALCEGETRERVSDLIKALEHQSRSGRLPMLT
eukprot:m.141176 g.141176  ORF g.141176 m.141176 type:complete len:493 (-) comp30166_c0_seq1:705-2183(-)